MADYILENGQKLFNVHDPKHCVGRHCPIHNQSAQAKAIGPQYWRFDRALMERICHHGVGHPDPDAKEGYGSRWRVVGLHGCCVPREGVEDAG